MNKYINQYHDHINVNKNNINTVDILILLEWDIILDYRQPILVITKHFIIINFSNVGAYNL